MAQSSRFADRIGSRAAARFAARGLACAIAALAAVQAGGFAEQAPAPSGAILMALSLVAVAFWAGVLRWRAIRRRGGLASGLHRLAESFGDVIVAHDRLGAAVSVSRNSEDQFGLPPARLLGRGLFEHVHVADRPAYLSALADAGAGACANAVLRLRANAGDGPGREPAFLWVDMRARRCGAGASGGGVVAALRNVSEAKWRENDLEAARARAEAASLSKDRFLANMSHELRTPLNAIIGFSEILGTADLAPADPAKQREYAAIIHQSGQHLISVVNSILDLSKIEAGAQALSAAPFALAPLIESCCGIVELQAKERCVSIARHFADGLDAMIGDVGACRQIVLNLLSNAVKFTPAGGAVSISIWAEEATIHLLVADSGVGMAAQDLARIGSRFFQAASAPAQGGDGTGLGLSIVRGLVGLHGGSIAVASETGQGTSVLVRLPQDCRGVASAAAAGAAIETIAHYRRGDGRAALQQTMVKKIA